MALQTTLSPHHVDHHFLLVGVLLMLYIVFAEQQTQLPSTRIHATFLG